jgi:hypothetical protein
MLKLNGRILKASGGEKENAFPVMARFSGFTIDYLNAVETDETDLTTVITAIQNTAARKAGNGNTRLCGMTVENATIITTAIEQIACQIESEHGKGYSLICYNLRYDNQRIIDQIA